MYHLQGLKLYKKALKHAWLSNSLQKHTTSPRGLQAGNTAESTGFRLNKSNCTEAGLAEEQHGQRRLTLSPWSTDAPFSKSSPTVLVCPFPAAHMRAVQPPCASHTTTGTSKGWQDPKHLTSTSRCQVTPPTHQAWTLPTCASSSPLHLCTATGVSQPS